MSIFSSIPAPKLKRSRFNMSHEYKTTCDFGALIPYMVREVLPGDVWNVNSDFLVRFAPMLAPIMQHVNVRTECFFVPNRLIFRRWEDFITGGEDGTATPVLPHAIFNDLNTETATGIGSLCDYLGMPVTINSPVYRPYVNITNGSINLLQQAAYQLIYQTYYRDQNLEPASISFPLGEGRQSGTVLSELLKLRYRAWEKDYFTSALPWTQRGVAASVPLANDLEVVTTPNNSALKFRRDDGAPFTNQPLQVGDSVDGNGDLETENGEKMVPSNLVVSGGASFTINDLRRTSALQRWLENNARGGSRYIEQILSHFGVISSDSRLQRPEYLGGGKSPAVISEVLQTSATDSTSPQANMAGHGIAGGINHGCLRRFEEHGFIVCIMSLVPRSSYIAGLQPSLTRSSKLDYAFPELARLGEQPIYKRELSLAPDSGTHNWSSVFGYTPRYADWKYINSQTTGQLRSSMLFWHMSRDLSGVPNLNNSFVKIDPSQLARVFAAGNLSLKQQLVVRIRNNVTASRYLPKYGVPILT